MADASKSNIINAEVNSYHHVIAELFPADSIDVEFHFNEDDESQTVRAHTQFLSYISPVFKSMFNGNWKENDNNVRIEDANYDDFEAFMQCLYGKKIEINQDNVDTLMYLSNKYNIDGISNNCSAFMVQELSIDNVLNSLNNAIIYDLAALQVACETFVSGNTAAIFELPDFLKCNKNTLTAILKLNKISCDETEMFDNCMKWAKQRCQEKELDENGENLRKELGDCLTLIRFKEMSNDDFIKRCKLYNSGFFSGDLLCELMIYFHGGNLLANKRYLAPPEPKTNAEIDYKFHWKAHKEVTSFAECTIQFSTSKPLILTKICFSSILLKATDDEWIGQPITGNIRISKDGQTIYTRSGKNAGSELSDWLIGKILIQEDKYKLNLKLELTKRIGRSFVHVYDIKETTMDGVSLVIHENENGDENQLNFLSTLIFEKFDKSKLHSL